MNKFEEIYHTMVCEASDADKKLLKTKLVLEITNRYYELKEKLLDEVFSDRAYEAVADQLDYYLINSNRLDKKILESFSSDNFDEFKIDDKKINQLMINCMIKHFESMFVEQREMLVV